MAFDEDIVETPCPEASRPSHRLTSGRSRLAGLVDEPWVSEFPEGRFVALPLCPDVKSSPPHFGRPWSRKDRPVTESRHGALACFTGPARTFPCRFECRGTAGAAPIHRRRRCRRGRRFDGR